MSPDPAPQDPLRLRLAREEGLQPERALGLEWLEVNGRGGYASSTALCCPTRRYHGLLVTPLEDRPERHVFLSRFDEAARLGAHTVRFSMARYPGAFWPEGHECISAFELSPHPRTWYRVGTGHVLREILMVAGEPAVLCRYTWLGEGAPIELRLRPHVPFRPADALTFENFELDPRSERTPGGFSCRPYGALPRLYINVSHPLAHYEPDPVWHHSIEYAADLARGYDGHEDHFSPGWMHVPLEAGASVVVSASIAGPLSLVETLFDREATRRRAQAGAVSEGVRGSLELAAEAFTYRTPGGRAGVVAGFPWFGEWGRDTAIALPGLTLPRGRVEGCGEALEGLASTLRDGLLPNIFGADAASSDYGSVDASLWYARAVQLYDQAGGERARMARLREVLRSIATGYMRGGPLGLRVDARGLLQAGDPMHNATWMDARVDGGPVTPRDGAAVEMVALWYSLLAHLEVLATSAGDEADARRWARAKRKTGRGFLAAFWIEAPGYLADVVRDEDRDEAVRPNMILAAALEFSPLTQAQRRSIVDLATRELLTPRGLRTLSPAHWAYHDRYEGTPAQRDSAYHQGTAWPWLLGSYVEAALRARPRSSAERRRLRALLDDFAPHLAEAGLLQVSEVFDGDAPHRPGGCIAQAWSVSELLRAYALLEGARA